jgi:hypothetical protein
MIVDFNSCTWTDPWFRKLPLNAKFLFIYLWTNSHKNTAGIYPLALEIISFEAGLPFEQVEKYLKILHPKVKYDFEKEIVWIVNHVKHQFMRTGNVSFKIIINLVKCLAALPEDHPFVSEFLEKYHTLSIEYPYPMKKVSIYPTSGGEGKGAGKGDGDGMQEYSSKCITPNWNEIGVKKT